MAVAEVVEAEWWELVLADEASPRGGEAVGVDRFAVAAVDDQVGCVPGRPLLCLAAGLSAVVFLEQGGERFGQGDCSA